MEDDIARISISISEGKFEISGSEEFVSAQIENFKILIENGLGKAKFLPTNSKKNNSNNSNGNGKFEKSSDQDTSFLDKYADIFAMDDDNILIVTDIPGKSSAAKTLNVALLYAFAQKKLHDEDAKVDDIRKICVSHGCLDVANFSSYIKRGDPKLYIDKGKSKGRFIKLTRPGLKKAEELLSEILENAEQ